MDPHFPPLFYGQHAMRLGHKAVEKNSVHNLRYGPRIQLIRGMSAIDVFSPAILFCHERVLFQALL
jgi:hypothetical protein